MKDTRNEAQKREEGGRRREGWRLIESDGEKVRGRVVRGETGKR